MFAKLYKTHIGQILVKLDNGDDGAEVRLYFKPKNLGVCSIAFNWTDNDNETQWKKADSLFKKMTETKALDLASSTIDELSVFGADNE